MISASASLRYGDYWLSRRARISCVALLGRIYWASRFHPAVRAGSQNDRLMPDALPPIDLAHEDEFTLGALIVRPSERIVVVGGQEEVLEPRVMQVLVALGRRAGKVTSRDDLVALCWGGRAVGEDAIQRPVARARKLGAESGAF